MRYGAVLFTSMLISAAWGADPFQQDISLDEISRKGKASTVLVMVPEFGEGTAFCVHQDGWFITNSHVIVGHKPKTGPIKLIVNSGLPNEKVVTAKVVRTDEKHDLALLQVNEKIDIKPLALSPSEVLNELNEIYAFGFPFGHSLSSDGKNHPTISVNAGKVTSLRRKDRVLELIQIDASVNPGNSGGPLLNRQGQVVGIVVAGIKGSGVHFAVPTEFAAELMKKPDIKFTMPNIGKTELTKEHEFTAQVISMQPNEEYSVVLHLKVGNLPEQHLSMKKEGSNYRVKVVPMSAPAGPKQLAVTAVIGDDSISARALDTATLRIGEKSYALKEIKELVNSTTCKAKLVNGTEVSGALSTKDRFALLMAGKELELDLTKLKELKVTHEAGPESMSAKVTASQQNKELASVAHSVIFKSLFEIADEMGGGKGTGGEAREMGKEGSSREAPPGKESSGPINAAPRARTRIAPPLMEERKEIKLPGSVADATVGGGGRFLILHLPLVRQVAIFDVSEAKVVKYLSVDDEEALIAAGLNKLFIALPKKNLLQKYDLHTFEREKTIPLPGNSGAGYMGTGSDVDGVLVFSPKRQDVGASRGAIFLSSLSLQELPIRSPETGMSASYPPQVRFSGGGIVFSSWTPGLSPSGLRTFVINTSGVQHYYEHTSVGYLLPSHDGRIIYTPSGLYTYEGKPLSGQTRNGGARMNGHYPIPSTRENWYLDCQPPSVMNRGEKPPVGESGVQVTLNLASTSRPIANLENIDLSEVPIELANRSNKLGFDKRVHFIAEANTVVLIPNSNDRLILYKVDIDELLKKSEIDYFFVMSTPKITAPKGSVYSYPIEVRSKQAGVKYRVEAGPSGLKVNAQGVVTWQVPARIEEESVDVIIAITNGAGEELLHDFRISIPGNRGMARPNRPAGKK